MSLDGKFDVVARLAIVKTIHNGVMWPGKGEGRVVVPGATGANLKKSTDRNPHLTK